MLKPLGDRIIVEVEAESKETAGGIILPGDQEKPVMGTVVSVGIGRITEQGQRIASEVSIGDKVIFAKYAGNVVKAKDKEFLVIRESDVLVIVE